MHYSLDRYSWSGALRWGNFKGHLYQTTQGNFTHKFVHGVIALIEFLPIVSQIISVFEKILVEKIFSSSQKPLKKVEIIQQARSPSTQKIQQTINQEQFFKSEKINSVNYKKVNKSIDELNGPLTPVVALKELNLSAEIIAAYEGVHSNKTVDVLEGIFSRMGFMKHYENGQLKPAPVIISKSDFVPEEMVEHLMRNKKDSALGVKYCKGDMITNMEGALHTFVTPVCIITMVGDYAYHNGHMIMPLGQNKGRKVILSAAIQPDFENPSNDEIVMKIVALQKKPIIGRELPSNFPPLIEQCSYDQGLFNRNIQEYDRNLQEHMVYHLTKDHRLPSYNDFQASDFKTFDQAVTFLEGLILLNDPDLDFIETLHDQYVNINNHIISLEALFNLFVHQLRNEFSILEILSQGYIYTIDPPVIFAKQIGGSHQVKLLNRLQMLGFKYLKQSNTFKNLKQIGFASFADPEAIPLLKRVFPDKIVTAKNSLFQKFGSYSVSDDSALVLHNNSDAFGQNFETESSSSLDGVIGSFSDLACQLFRTRIDLVETVV